MITLDLTLTGKLISTIGKSGFAAHLAGALKEIAPFNYMVVFGYLGTRPPLDLYDNFPQGKRKIFVEDYQEGPYLLDPYYTATTKPIDSGLYRLRDLAPDRFYQGEYFRNYYVQTGLAEEIAFLINLPEGAVVTVSLMRTEKAFSAKELREMREFLPVVLAASEKHWEDLALNFSTPNDAESKNAHGQRLEAALREFGKGLLTPREREVVEFTLKGHSAVAVGHIMGISPGTVRIHRRNIYSKLRIRSQGELFSGFIEAMLKRPD